MQIAGMSSLLSLHSNYEHGWVTTGTGIQSSTTAYEENGQACTLWTIR